MGAQRRCPTKLENNISQGRLPGRGDRNYVILLCLCMAELPHSFTPACPIMMPLSQMFIYEHTLKISPFHPKLSITGIEPFAVD